MVIQEIEKQYIKYTSQKNSRWEYGNGILYKMCNDNPLHNDENIIIGKIWLIGRSYAAAIERRKSADDYKGDDFYYDVVGPKILEVGEEIDERIRGLKKNTVLIKDCIQDVLGAHKLLMDVFKEMTGLEKRSLASKYLHFHCPDKFFIYDSRACTAINKIVKNPDKSIISGINDYDKEYGNFICKMIELQNYLIDHIGTCENPRALDDFLLAMV